MGPDRPSPFSAPPNPRPNLPPGSHLRGRSSSTGVRGVGPPSLPPAGYYGPVPPQPQVTPPSHYNAPRPSLSYYNSPYAQPPPQSHNYQQNGTPLLLHRRSTIGGAESFQAPSSGSGGHAGSFYAQGPPPRAHPGYEEGHSASRREEQQFAYYAEETAQLDMDEGEDAEEGEESKKRPKTPPDMCAVCGVTETPEWRKGPAGVRSLCNGCGLLAAKRARERTARGYNQPASIEHMQRELVGIGAERFKSVDGSWGLPLHTHERILATIERTSKQIASLAINSKSRSAKTKADKQAAGTLVGMSRRASTSSTTSAPRSPPARTRRSGSIRGSTASNAPPPLRLPPPDVAPPSETFGTRRSYSPTPPFIPSSNKMSISFIAAPPPAQWSMAMALERERQMAGSGGRGRSHDVDMSGPARSRTPSPGPVARPSSFSRSASLSRR